MVAPQVIEAALRAQLFMRSRAWCMMIQRERGSGLEVKGQGVYRTASRREDMPLWGAAFTLDGQPTEYAGSGGAGVTRPLCLRGERHGLG